MNTSQINAYLAVCRNLSVSKAAEELYLAQSAVSRYVLKLEEELGVALFLRKGNRLSFTECGQELYNYFLRGKNELDALLAAYSPGGTGPSRAISCAAFPVWDFSRQIVGCTNLLQEENPDWNLNVKFLGSGEIMAALRQGEVDAAFHLGSVMESAQGISSYRMGRVRNVLVCSHDHRLYQKNVLSGAELAKETFLYSPDSTLAETALISHIYSLGKLYSFEPKIMALPDTDALTLMLESGRGVALMDELSRYLTNPLLRNLPTQLSDTVVLAVNTKSHNDVLPSFISEAGKYFLKNGVRPIADEKEAPQTAKKQHTATIVSFGAACM